MTAIVTIGIDLAKNAFAVHGVDATGNPALLRPSVPREAARTHRFTARLPDRHGGLHRRPPLGAHKLARLLYAMLTQGQDYFEERYRQRVLHNLAQKAKAMGMQLVPSDKTA